MRQYILLLLLSLITYTAFAQKNVTPVSKSAITGITLPAGSRKDSRMLSTVSAKMLLELESKKVSATLSATEVLLLPPVSSGGFGKDSLAFKLSGRGWKIVPVQGDEQYLWLLNDKRSVIAWFSMDSTATSLYLAESVSTPVFISQGPNTTTNQPAAQPAILPASHQAVQQPAKPVALPADQSVNQPILNKSDISGISSPIIGTWRRGKGVTLYGGRWSYTAYQYTFNSNGTYSYIIKTYVEDDKETLLTRETGTFSVNGEYITLDPKTNVIEAWSKSNGGDNYKDIISSQNKPLEKIMYKYTIQLIPELKETGLILLYGSETVRDGRYNGGDSFPNGWRFSPEGPDYKPIKLPGQ